MDVDRVFKALADPTRRRLLDALRAESGQTLGSLCDGLDMTRQAVTQHLARLEEANLVATIRRGREKLHYLNPVPIHEIFERWISKYERRHLDALSDLKKRTEGAEHGKARIRLRDVHRDDSREGLERARRR
ncbi:MAG TPA: metalloregulator ArsR/SmtB family transcription factor [Thermoanaerobaculia bacterium]|nr:metalloregulator ArsR/SmtB family transcription factor [Thermoanaerobaculia bacterium]